MKNLKIGIYDKELSYAFRLMEALNAKKQIYFLAEVFTSEETLCEYLKGNSLDILLITDQEMQDKFLKYSIDKVILLSEGERLVDLSEYPTIYKYQSSDAIIREIMNYYAETAVANKIVSKANTKIYAIYSPVKRVSKTAFALAFGQMVAKEHSALYLKLEALSGINHLMDQKYERDLADLMYYVRQGTDNVIYLLNGMIQHMQSLDYVPPIISPMDIREISIRDWLALIQVIIEYSTYEVLILDFDEGVSEFYKLLELCQEIYMPVLADELSLASIKEYEDLLAMTGKEEIMKKTMKIKLPYDENLEPGGVMLEQLIEGKMGEYVNNLVWRQLD